MGQRLVANKIEDEVERPDVERLGDIVLQKFEAFVIQEPGKVVAVPRRASVDADNRVSFASNASLEFDPRKSAAPVTMQRIFLGNS